MTMPDLTRLLNRPRLMLAVLLLGAAALFAANIADPFVSDDWHLFWIAAHRSRPLLAYFLTNYEGATSGGSYRPFVTVLWSVVAVAGGGLSPAGRLVGHGITLGFHLVCVALVFRIGRQLVPGRRGIALGTLAAALFAVFPNHAEAVNWVAAASDPAATAGVLGAVTLYLDAHAAPKRRITRIVGMAACFAAALLAKETAAILPGVIALHLAFTAKRPWRTAARDAALLLVPLALVAASYVVVRYRATGLLYGYYGAAHISVDLMVAARAFLAIPASFVLAGTARTVVMGEMYRVVDTHLEAILLAALVPALLVLFRARAAAWWLAAAFVLSMLPVMQFGLNHLPGRWSDEGARYGYMPSAFGALLLAWALLALWRHARRMRPAVVALAFALLAFCGAQLVLNNALWFRAGRFAERVARTWPAQTAEQVFVYGLPDNLRGVPLWRNGFSQRLEAEAKRPADLRVSDIRTVMDAPHGFWADTAGDFFSYHDDPPTDADKDIVGPLFDERVPTSYGYLSALPTDFAIYALTYRRFASEATAVPEPTNRSSAAAFWTGDGWEFRPLPTAGIGIVE